MDEHVPQLFKDFTAAIKRESEPYFLGTVVTVSEGDDQLLVVDGQQRLGSRFDPPRERCVSTSSRGA